MKMVYISGQISDIPYTLAYMNFKEAEQEVIDLMYKERIEERIKELKQEVARLKKIASHNTWHHLEEYIGLLQRRIEAYEKILPTAENIVYGIKVAGSEAWRL